MIRSEITNEIIEVMNILVGKIPGGLAVVTVFSCMFFAAISGSGPGTTAAIGSIMIPAMLRKGYQVDFAGAVSASGGALGVIIPPSNPMIVYGVLANVSIADLFNRRRGARHAPRSGHDCGLLVHGHYQRICR